MVIRRGSIRRGSIRRALVLALLAGVIAGVWSDVDLRRPNRGVPRRSVADLTDDLARYIYSPWSSTLPYEYARTESYARGRAHSAMVKGTYAGVSTVAAGAILWILGHWRRLLGFAGRSAEWPNASLFAVALLTAMVGTRWGYRAGGLGNPYFDGPYPPLPRLYHGRGLFPLLEDFVHWALPDGSPPWDPTGRLELGGNRWDAFSILQNAIITSGSVLCACGILALLRRRRGIYAREIPSCSGCSYDLTGNTSGRCPECGAAVDRGDESLTSNREVRG